MYDWAEAVPFGMASALKLPFLIVRRQYREGLMESVHWNV